MSGVPGLTGATGGGGGTGGGTGVSSGTQQLLGQLSSAEQQALADMTAIQVNQIQFNDKMNDASTAKTISQQFHLST